MQREGRVRTGRFLAEPIGALRVNDNDRDRRAMPRTTFLLSRRQRARYASSCLVTPENNAVFCFPIRYPPQAYYKPKVA